MNPLHHSRILIYGISILLLSQLSFCREIDMKSHWNDQIPLENPHKGWYHHYPDNHINKYIIQDDSHILDFPGMDHIYIRLAWSYLEPEEGKFNWNIIDSIIGKWVEKGLGIAFRISCKETSTDRIEQQFATPKWVMEAGAKGDYYRRAELVGPEGPWEPVYDDPIFLEKLENFLKVFANRYDGKPWLRYVDIGSVGDWGEGHTHAGSRLDYNFEQRKIHIDLYRKYFQQTQLIISDGFVFFTGDKEDYEKMHRYILRHGISYRDDSILVNYFVRGYSDSYTVRSPDLFRDSYLTMPNVLELQHYPMIKREGNWWGKPGSSLQEFGKGKSGADMFRGAIDLLRATYIGYHGDAHEWLTDNPELTEELLNRCGYWFFLHSVNIPESLPQGESCQITMTWENKGVAPAYHPYVLKIRLEGPDTIDFEVDSNNQNWIPQKGKFKETYSFTIPDTIPTGQYTLKMKLYSQQENRNVYLALDPQIMDENQYYKITKLNVN